MVAPQMKRLLLATTAFASIAAEPARADPIITPLVVSALTAVGVSATATVVGTLTVGALVTGLVEIGLSLGVTALLASGRKPRFDPSMPIQPTLQRIEAQSISPRYYGAGRIPVGGVKAWEECEDGFHFLVGVILNGEPIDAVENYIIDGEDVVSWSFGPFQALTGFTNGVIETIDAGPDVRWPSAGLKYAFQYIQIWTGQVWRPEPVGNLPAMAFDFRNGLPDGNPSPLAAHFLPTLYDTERHLGKNLAIMYAMAVGGQVILDRMKTYPRAWPTMMWIIRAATIYDPREEGQTFDDTEILPFYATSRADYLDWYFTQKATWAWSRNAILVLVWYETHYDGGRRPPSKIRWDQVITEATYCDRPVAKYGGGTEPWALSDAQWHAGEEVRDVEARLKAACDCTIWEDGEGMLNFWIAKDEIPTVTITDDDISEIVIEDLPSALDTFNYLTVSYMEPRENYQVIEAPPVVDDESISIVGERTEAVTFREVASFNQAYRLGHRLFKRKNPARRLTIIGNFSLVRCIGERVVAVQSDSMPHIDGVYRFEAPTRAPDDLTAFQINLALVGEHDYDDVVPSFDPVSPHETSSAPVPSPVTITPPDAPVLAQITITSDEYIQSTAKVAAATPTDTSLVYYVQVRLVDALHAPLGPWESMDTVVSQWVRQTTNPVTSGQIYEARSWFVQLDAPSQMSASSYITIS
jgi:hypothetical protein